MARFKRGDQVTIVDREVTPADRKSGLYYPHFRGLHGVVDQVYEEEGEICVEVDQESLSEDFRRRHQGIATHITKEWLGRLSEVERRSLPEEHKQITLKYTIMVAPEDLAPAGRGRARKPAEQPAATAQAAEAAPAASRAAGPASPRAGGPAPRPATAAEADTAPAHRPSEDELTAAEQAHLEELLRRAKKA